MNWMKRRPWALLCLLAVSLIIMGMIAVGNHQIMTQGQTAWLPLQEEKPYATMTYESITLSPKGLDVITPTLSEGNLQAGERVYVTYALGDDGTLRLNKYYTQKHNVPQNTAYVELSVSSVEKATTQEGTTAESGQYVIHMKSECLTVYLSPVEKQLLQQELEQNTQNLRLMVRIKEGRAAFGGLYRGDALLVGE